MEENIRVNLKEIIVNTRSWSDLAQDRDCWRAFVNAALPPDSISHEFSYLSLCCSSMEIFLKEKTAFISGYCEYFKLIIYLCLIFTVF